MATFTIDLSKVPPQEQGTRVGRQTAQHPKLREMPVLPSSRYQPPPAHVTATGPLPRWLDPSEAKWTRERVRVLDRGRA